MPSLPERMLNNVAYESGGERFYSSKESNLAWSRRVDPADLSEVAENWSISSPPRAAAPWLSPEEKEV